MSKLDLVNYKIADETWEFESIHRLNYRTFVQEISQHRENVDGILIDKFHDQNTYIVAVSGRTLLGMVVLRGDRPFSLDQKLENIDQYLPVHTKLCEIRLLAIDKNFRSSLVLPGLLRKLMMVANDSGYDLAVLSGFTEQLKLYAHFGCETFGPLVGKSGAEFQPMFLTVSKALEFKRRSKILQDHCIPENTIKKIVNYLPGPVNIDKEVKKAFSSDPKSHRSEIFQIDFDYTRKLLCNLVKAESVQLLMGTGTLANDIVAAHLALLKGKGVIIENGEFGKRLIDHASRAGLDFVSLHLNSSETISGETLRQGLNDNNDVSWVWVVHCETSTGILNDVTTLKNICRQSNLKLCLDCISSIGALPVNLSDVFLASTVSGKALGSRSGLAIVFHDKNISSLQGKLPRYLDLRVYIEKNGIPFTVSSQQIYALTAAIRHTHWHERYSQILHKSAVVRNYLDKRNIKIISNPENAAPHVISIQLADNYASKDAGEFMELQGVLLSYRSEYLVENNILQICFMGEASRSTYQLSALFEEALLNADRLGHAQNYDKLIDN